MSYQLSVVCAGVVRSIVIDVVVMRLAGWVSETR